MITDYGSDPLGDGKWRLIPSGEIVDLAGLKEFNLNRKQKVIKNDCLGMSWDEIERKQGGKLKRNIK